MFFVFFFLFSFFLFCHSISFFLILPSFLFSFGLPFFFLLFPFSICFSFFFVFPFFCLFQFSKQLHSVETWCADSQRGFGYILVVFDAEWWQAHVLDVGDFIRVGTPRTGKL